MTKTFNLDSVVASYIACALWSSNDESREDGGDPLDDNYGPEDLTPDALSTMRKDCANFLEYAAGALAESGLDEESIGHNFWLNRNGHGTGFWDLGLGKVGQALSDAAKTFGSAYLFVNGGVIIHG